MLRSVERRMLFLERGAPRPILAVPHLLAGDIERLLPRLRDGRDGGRADARPLPAPRRAPRRQPAHRPDLARHYWQPGNSRGFGEFVRDLTGAPLSARPLAERVNRTVDSALVEARRSVERLPSIPRFEGPVGLDAKIRVIHGRETVAELGAGGFEPFARDFGRWIDGGATSR
jgi:hypothetical protein